MRGIYPILDLDACQARGLAPLEVGAALLTARPALLQLRAKGRGARETLELLRALRVLTQQAGTLLFANDRPDLALLAGCDGVHVGQSDISISEVRSFAPQLKVGVSTHDLSELQAALKLEPDYVAFGPVFGTDSKRNAEPEVGVDLLGEAYHCARTAGIPLVAIGGIQLENLGLVADRVDLIAVIAAVLGTDLVTTEARVRALAARFA